MDVLARPGRMRDRITVQEKTESRDAVGGVVETWSDVGPRWAKVTPLRSGEQQVAKQENMLTTHKIEMRAYEGLNSSRNRFKFRRRILNIDSIINTDERDVMMEVQCVEQDI